MKFIYFVLLLTKFRRNNSKAVHTAAINLALFPNRTQYADFNDLNNARQLQINKTPYTKLVPCVKCSGLSVCNILTGFQIQEVYYPENLGYLESCKGIEALGQRVQNEIFGNGKSFRNTAQCKGSTDVIIFNYTISWNTFFVYKI